MKNFYNIKEINIFKKLIASGVHIGKKTNKWNPKTSIYLFGQRKTNNLERGKEANIVTKTKGINIHIIDIEQTIVMLRRAITFIQKISQNRGIILYVPSKMEKRLWVGELEETEENMVGSILGRKTNTFNKEQIGLSTIGTFDGISSVNISPAMHSFLNTSPINNELRNETEHMALVKERSNSHIINNLNQEIKNEDNGIIKISTASLSNNELDKKDIRLLQLSSNKVRKEKKRSQYLRADDSYTISSRNESTLKGQEYIEQTLDSTEPLLDPSLKDISSIKKEETINNVLNMEQRPKALYPRSKHNKERKSNIREKIFEINKQRSQNFYIPQALFITNTTEHKTLIREAVKLQIPIIGIIDTNGNSYGIEFPIPGNTESIESQEIYTQIMFYAMADGKKKEILDTYASDSYTSNKKEKK